MVTTNDGLKQHEFLKAVCEVEDMPGVNSSLRNRWPVALGIIGLSSRAKKGGDSLKATQLNKLRALDLERS